MRPATVERMIEPLIETYTRLHNNGMIGTVDRVTFNADTIVYSAGTLRPNSHKAIRLGLSSYQQAKAYADAEAREMGHTCDAKCGEWPAE